MAPKVLPETVTLEDPSHEMRGAGTVPATPARGVPTTAAAQAERPFRLYLITERATGRRYVGLTTRPEQMRLRAHWYRAGRAGHRHRPGSLGAAMRRAREQGDVLEQAFAMEVLEVVPDSTAARRRERDWIVSLRTASPTGFTLMPRGASFGGPANSRITRVRGPDGRARTFGSFGDAWAWWHRCWQSAAPAQVTAWTSQGLHRPTLGLAHARIGLGWSVEEALGMAAHADRRGRRDGGVLVDGVWCQHLREVQDVAAIPTLRSRLHRARQAGLDGEADLAADRRRQGQPRQTRRVVRLPAPDAPDGPRHLTLRDLAARSGIAFATLQHRLRKLERQGMDPAAMSGDALLARLLAPVADRRTVLTIRLRGGRVLRGGQRELVRLVQDDPALQPLRIETLSEPAIRRRLRLVGAGATQRALRWALGLRGGRSPVGSTEVTRSEANR
ncbi:GIY-YIG nuclease family protein [Roseococcus sp. DSY-14]|uniref:GIY-YIG nuclease family protein n=1 Tax=Roseococcus sp. DSY-14 TaxID=3369650 RepID=UPI00387B22E4